MFYTQAMHTESTPDIHWHTYALTLPSPSPDVGILAPQTDILPEALSQNRKTSMFLSVLRPEATDPESADQTPQVGV